MNDMVVESFKYCDIPKGILPLVTIYHNTSDYPEKFVARLWYISNGEKNATNVIMLADNIDVIRKGLLPCSMFFARSLEDDACVVESWL